MFQFKKNNPFLYLLLFILLCIQANSQDVIYDSVLHSGLYSDFFSFRKNTPTQPGKIEFKEVKAEKKVGIFFQGKPLDNQSLQNNYWGFSYEGNIYVNVLKFWNELEQSNLPKAPFFKIKEVGYYSIIEIETKVSAALLGAMYGGIIGGLIGAAIDASDPRITREIDETDKSLVLVVLDHEFGHATHVTKYSITFLLAHYPDLLEDFQKEKKVSYSTFIKYLQELNKRKYADKITFNEKKQWPVITIVRKTNNQTNNALPITLNNNVINTLSESVPYFQDTIPPNQDFVISVEGYKAEISFNLSQNKKAYFEVSQNIKKPDEIIIRKIDYTNTKYTIEHHDKRRTQKSGQ